MDRLWVEKYRPKSLRELDYHKDINEILTKLAQSGDFPHLLFYGPNGAGKKTRIMAFLREVYGNGVYTVNEEEREFKVSESSSTMANCSILTSKFHIDVTPSDADNHDKVIVQKLIKEIASSHQLNSKLLKEFKVCVINEVDNLSKEAQASLRRTMEKYVEKCRLILCCESLARVIHPIRSRCLLIRIPAPHQEEIQNVLQGICDNEKLNYNEKYGMNISRTCKGNEFQLLSIINYIMIGNLREAILCLQAGKIKQYPFADNQSIEPQEWKTYIDSKIVDTIVKNQTPEGLKEIRERFYELLVNCIPGDRIIKEILEKLLLKCKQSCSYGLIQNASECENKMRYGQSY